MVVNHLLSFSANMDPAKLQAQLEILKPGIYCGRAILHGVTYGMSLSVGWSPFYNNPEKTVEAHLLHSFEEDFYGATLQVVVEGFIREESSFNSLDELIAAIEADNTASRQWFSAHQSEV
jgi:FAD synthase